MMRDLLPAIARQRWWIAGSLAVCVLTLVGTAVDGLPLRSLPVELRMLLVTYTVGLYATLVHIRRRRPEWLQLAVRWYSVAYALRVLTLCLVVLYEVQIVGSVSGHVYPDSVGFDLMARMLAKQVTGQSYGLGMDVPQAVSPLLALSVLLPEIPLGTGAIGVPAFAWLALVVNHVTVLACLIALCGYSALALGLPFVALGSFWAIQVPLLLSRYVHPKALRWLAVYLLVAPEFLVHSIVVLKDVVTAVVLTHWVELLLDRRRMRPTARWSRLILVMLVGYAFRPFLLSFMALTTVFVMLRAKLSSPRLRRLVDWFVLLAFYVHLKGAPRYKDIGSSAVGGYWTGVFINVLLMWGPSMFVAPKTYQSFQYLSWLGLALLWPMLSGWLLPGLVLYRARRLRYPHTVAFVTAMYLLLAASRYPGAFGAGRVQLPVVPFMVAWVFETIVVARELRPASRRLLGAAVALHYTAMMLAHCGLALKRFG